MVECRTFAVLPGGLFQLSVHARLFPQLNASYEPYPSIMINPQQLVIERFTSDLEVAYRQTYGMMKPEIASVISWAGRLALENISNSDMLYHDVEHTMLVTSVGQQILIGKHLCEGAVKPVDWLNFMMALLFHDVGYVRGVCRADAAPVFATGKDDEVVSLPDGITDAAMTPYHVSRSQLFVRERFGRTLTGDFDPEVIASMIEMTRFPPPNLPEYKRTDTFGGLVRAADFIGQLGDPGYLRKIPALYYEFEQLGTNQKLGYTNPDDMRRGYAGFYWKVVSPYIQDAIKYLRVTLEGKQWIANLHSHVFEVEHSGQTHVPW